MFRSQRRPTRQGAIDAAAAVEKTDQAPARTATAKPDARRTIAQTRRGQERGGQGLCAAGHLHAHEGSAGHIRNVPLRTRPEEIAAGRREGGYLLRSNIKSDDPGYLWRLYLQLVEVEQAFKELKNDLSIRPIYHQLETRIEAHIFIAFLAYCLFVTLKLRLKTLAPGLTPRAVLEKLAAMQMIDVELPTTDNRVVVLSRYTEPEKDLLLLLRQLQIQLPAQPPPKIKARNNREVA